MKVGIYRVRFRPRGSSYSPESNDRGIGRNKAGPKFGVFLGGVTCSFRREIKPYVGFEIWTRVLAWDEKWLYLVSHIVRKGATKPTSYTLQPWKKGSKRIAANADRNTNGSANGTTNGGVKGIKRSARHPAIYATSIAKYVFKEGRITIPPEVALRDAELLPPRPKGTEVPAPVLSEDSALEGTTVENTALQAAGAVEELLADDDAALDPTSGMSEDAEWTWERVEAERKRGMELARHLAGLDGLTEVWSGAEGPALGEW